MSLLARTPGYASTTIRFGSPFKTPGIVTPALSRRGEPSKNIRPTGTPYSFCGLIEPAATSTNLLCSLSPAGRGSRYSFNNDRKSSRFIEPTSSTYSCHLLGQPMVSINLWACPNGKSIPAIQGPELHRNASNPSNDGHSNNLVALRTVPSNSQFKHVRGFYLVGRLVKSMPITFMLSKSPSSVLLHFRPLTPLTDYNAIHFARASFW